MYSINKILEKEPFSINQKKKNILFREYINKLTKYHFKN